MIMVSCPVCLISSMTKTCMASVYWIVDVTASDCVLFAAPSGDGGNSTFGSNFWLRSDPERSDQCEGKRTIDHVLHRHRHFSSESNTLVTQTSLYQRLQSRYDVQTLFTHKAVHMQFSTHISGFIKNELKVLDGVDTFFTQGLFHLKINLTFST